MSFVIHADQQVWLKREAARRQISMSEVVRLALRDIELSAAEALLDRLFPVPAEKSP
jgi:hypothetical protein